MAESPAPGGSPPSPPPEHLSVRGEGPAEPEMFLMGRQSSRMVPSVIGAIALDTALLVLFVILARFGVNAATTPPILPDLANNRIVWLPGQGPGGGGGGGGNKMKEPPRAAELPGKEKITVPAIKPPTPEVKVEPKIEPPLVEPVNIPAKTLAAATESLPGLVDAPTVPTPSQGSGSLGGAGTGGGSGIGPGTGSGLGPGSGGGTGGGVYRPGNGVTTPRALVTVKPAYTSDAMRAKVQGIVAVQCIVQPDGTVTDARVVRSLDSVFGLDQEALKAARQWKFAPGLRFGQPVPVEILIELQFSIR
jgi:periplasmic protein TonB